MKKFKAIILTVMASFSATTLACSGSYEICSENNAIEFTPISVEKISRAEIINLYQSEAPNIFKALSIRAAKSLESNLQISDRYSLGNQFFLYQISELRKLCPKCVSHEAGCEYQTAILVQDVAAALVTAGGLRSLAVDKTYEIVPRYYGDQLTDNMSILILAASCSSQTMPLINAELNKIGMKCYSEP